MTNNKNKTDQWILCVKFEKPTHEFCIITNKTLSDSVTTQSVLEIFIGPNQILEYIYIYLNKN